MFKRGVSPVVATVLLLVITVVIASIIFAFVVPFVNKSLGNSKVCLNVLDGVEFPESKFNCYVDYHDSNNNSDVKNIQLGLSDDSLRMVGVNYNSPLDFPSTGGQRTYVTNINYSRAE